MQYHEDVSCLSQLCHIQGPLALVSSSWDMASEPMLTSVPVHILCVKTRGQAEMHALLPWLKIFTKQAHM